MSEDLRSELMKRLYRFEPTMKFWEGLSRTDYIADGYHYDHPAFERVIQSIRPRIYIEVGTHLGASAIHAALTAERLGIDMQVICVDTWVGDFAFWADPQQFRGFTNGFPNMYDVFRQNVVNAGVDHRIIPVPATSLTAAALCKVLKIAPDVIYVDAAHEYTEVRLDLESWWPLLRSGGIMFGDDFDIQWPQVIRAVAEFSDRVKIPHMRHTAPTSTPQGKVNYTKWIMRKQETTGPVFSG